MLYIHALTFDNYYYYDSPAVVVAPVIRMKIKYINIIRVYNYCRNYSYFGMWIDQEVLM